MKARNCNSNGRKCNVDAGAFNLNGPRGEVSQIDLGNGRSFACKSVGDVVGRGAEFHAECVSPQGGALKNRGGGGAMNLIKRGTNSLGQDRIYGSVNVDGEICQIRPDATGEGTESDCTPEDEFPEEEDPQNEVPEFLGTSLPGDGDGDGGGGGFRESVTDPEDKINGLRGRSDSGRRLVDDAGGNLDTMVVWTAAAECNNAGKATGCARDNFTEERMRGTIDLAIAETNTAYELSGINTELRLVHAYLDDSYTEAGGRDTFYDALDKITGTNDGVMDDVHDKRNTYGADIVALLVHDTALCGLAHLGPRASKMFSVTAWNCATGYYSFGHEIGHNMGAHHDRGQTNNCDSDSFNFGYRDPQARFRSILAYNCGTGQCDGNAGGGCTRVQRFSNPTLGYNDSPIGIADKADNARHINSKIREIAQYRALVPECSSDADCDDSDPCTTNECDGVCVYKPMDCDDGNACTADTCSGGSCVNTDTTSDCDDGNICTTDTCDVFGGCSNTVVPNCCGNKICEANEDTDNCFEDCAVGPFTLAVPTCWAAGGCWQSQGNMFNVEAIDSDIVITSLKVHIYRGSVTEVWTRPGSYEGFTNSKNGWTMVASHDFTGLTYQFSAPMVLIPETSFTETVSISAGSTQAFYITTTSTGSLLFNSGDGSVSEDDNMRINQGRFNYYQFGSNGGPYMWNGEMIYMKDSDANPGFNATTTPPTSAVTPDPTNAPTPNPTDAPTNVATPNPTDSPTNVGVPNPTNNPTAEPTLAPTSSPSKNPTAEPTVSPTTSPTLNPTMSPTHAPSHGPSKSPTELPSVSLEPTMFVPEEVDLIFDSRSATVVKAAYFEVQGGDEWAKITNLKITTYRTRSLEVYYKYGSAAPYEATPCAWKKIAETSPSWNPGYWKRVFPPWVDGFEPVVLPPNEKVSFYLVNTGISYGILARSHTNSDRYRSPHVSLDATSPVGAIAISHGKGGYGDQRFRPNPDYYRGYGIFGGLKFETMQAGTTVAPTASPTEPTTPGQIESPFTGNSNMTIHGLQFDVENLGTDDIIVKKLSVVMAESGTHHLEVWFRDGSHKDEDSGTGCNNWNNWCNSWTKLTGSNVFSLGSSGFTSTPTFVAIAKAGAITSFAVVAPNAGLRSHSLTGSASNTVDNGLLKINLATPINNYYSNNVQTIDELSPGVFKFEGIIDYDIAHSDCAVLNMASWVVLDPNGADAMYSGDANADINAAGGEVEENVYEPSTDVKMAPDIYGDDVE